MLSTRKNSQGQNRDEAEKPFWISYADLMTALMVLFLVVMSVALLAVTKTVSEKEAKQESHRQEIADCLDALEVAAQPFSVNRELNSVNFGERARFDFNSAELTVEQQLELRRFVPRILRVAEKVTCKRWLRRVVVEGFTDSKGTYLYNLDLSLKRSRSVLCALLSASAPGEIALGPDEREKVRDLFVVGGYSFNSARETPEESRRIEFRLEFYGLEDAKGQPPTGAVREIGECREASW